jgi:hypothetical protein
MHQDHSTSDLRDVLSFIIVHLGVWFTTCGDHGLWLTTQQEIRRRTCNVQLDGACGATMIVHTSSSCNMHNDSACWQHLHHSKAIGADATAPYNVDHLSQHATDTRSGQQLLWKLWGQLPARPNVELGPVFLTLYCTPRENEQKGIQHSCRDLRTFHG